MNTRQIQALDLQKTVVLIPGGILEEHGPYMPSYTDGYAIDAYTQELAKAIVARPGWTVVIFPQIPLGNDPANTIGGKRVFPGSYPIRMATLRAVYMDLANELGEQGFRWRSQHPSSFRERAPRSSSIAMNGAWLARLRRTSWWRQHAPGSPEPLVHSHAGS